MSRAPASLLSAGVLLACLGLAAPAVAGTPIHETRPLQADGRLEVDRQVRHEADAGP